MKIVLRNKLLRWGMMLPLILLVCACSTTKKLAEGEKLYTGVKDIELIMPKKLKLPPKQKSYIQSPLNVAPNNPLFSPTVRSPLPTGLWVYNWNIKKEKGFKYWLYKKLAKKPVLLQDVQPELRVKMVENILQDYGVFNGKATYELHPKGEKKVKISYRIEVTQPKIYGKVDIKGWDQEMYELVKGVVSDGEIREGERYDVNLLEEERDKIAEVLRNNGYYFFQPSYIEYLADTIIDPTKAQLQIVMKASTPKIAKQRCRVGDIKVILHNEDASQGKDSIDYKGVEIVYDRPEQLKSFVVARAIKLVPGDYFSADLQRQSQTNLVQLNMFTYANVQVEVRDTLNPDLLDVTIDATFAKPREVQLEMDVASKSNNLLGPGVAVGVSNRNIFKRAENFSLQFTGSYEWQIGGNSGGEGDGLNNSYELGINASLNVPRIIGPKFVKSDRYRKQSTSFQLGTDFLNRNSFFRMLSFWGSSVYDFSFKEHVSHRITPFKLNYTYLLKTSEKFDSTINSNPAIAQSFRNQFIPSIGYTYTYDRPITYRQPNRLFWQASISQAGNILAGVDYLVGNRGSNKKFLGNIYSQFVKLTSELIGYKSIDDKNVFATRFYAGIGYAYGNTSVMPYSEQFYAGGSNGIRAFHIRSIGPGSYHPEVETSTSYLDQTGDIKLEGNVEYRYKIYGDIYGALFVDAGNVWLLKSDPMRPGGELTARNLLKDIALGTGFGLRYDFTYLVIRADLGIPIHAPYDTGRGGYYNIPDFWKGIVLNLAIGYPF